MLMRLARVVISCFTALSFLYVTALPGTCAISEQEQALHGWEGETYRKDGEALHEAVPRAGQWIETLSWHPRAFLFHNFLSPKQADALIAQAAPQMKRSTVVADPKSQALEVDNIRTSYGTFLNRLSSPAVELLEKKLANWTQMPIVHQEDVQGSPVQILRYEYGQKYGAHYDSLGRVCTVLVYLTDVEEGGETAFSKTTNDDWADPSQEQLSAGFSECAKGHVAARPKKGDALLFYSLKPDGKKADLAAMHTGCPLIRGIKWTATIWFHPTPFRPDDFHRLIEKRMKTGDPGYTATPGRMNRDEDPGVCIDGHEKCQEWADEGECDKNPGYMKGLNTDRAGVCRLSCRVCTACTEGDRACYFQNRADAGYLHLEQEVQQLTGVMLPAQF